MLSSKKVFFSLVRLGVGHQANIQSGDANWTEIKALADRQGLSAIVIDGLEKSSVKPPRTLLLEWIGR